MIVPGSVCLAYHPEHAWVPAVVDHFVGQLVAVAVVADGRDERGARGGRGLG